MISVVERLLQHSRATPAAKAYDLWADSYDAQPDNLMLHLDERIVNSLLERITGPLGSVVDVGCGTGRHWPKFHAGQASSIVGVDVSLGMLRQLERKYPQAYTLCTADEKLLMLPDRSADCVVSTLTVAHIPGLRNALHAWCRVLKQGGYILLTDFHPVLLASGGRRTFSHHGKPVTVRNHVHDLATIKRLLSMDGMRLVYEREQRIDATVRPFYERQDAVAVYERFAGLPLIYCLLFKKCA